MYMVGHDMSSISVGTSRRCIDGSKIPPALRGAHLGGGAFHPGGGLSTPFLQNMCHHVSTALLFPRGAPQVPLIAKSVKSWHWHQTAGVIIYKSGFYDIIINKYFLISGS